MKIKGLALSILTAVMVLSCGIPKEEFENLKKSTSAQIQNLKKMNINLNNKVKNKDSIIDSLSRVSQTVVINNIELEKKVEGLRTENTTLTEQVSGKINKKGKYYRIQIAAVKINKRNTSLFEKYDFTEADWGFYHFVFGYFENLKEAYRVLKVIKDAGSVSGSAWIVPYQDGERKINRKSRG